MMIYVAGKFSAETRADVEANIRAAVSVGLEVARVGAFPVIPHANTAHPEFEYLQPYRFWIDGTRILCRACDALITVPGWESSSGAKFEVSDMYDRGKPVFHSIEELDAWLSGRAGRRWP